MENQTFESVRIGLASPQQIREWSQGEVLKPETINYRTLKPERDGLFCEKIFGPTKDWECHCGKYKRMRYKDKICERCGVKVTKAKVRRERMGHIELAAPVSHIWYAKGIPTRMGLILDISPRNLEKVLYFAMYIVTDPGEGTPLFKGQTLDEKAYAEMRMKYEDDFKAGMGAEAIKQLLTDIDLDRLYEELSAEFEVASGQKRAKLLKRLEVVEAFRNSHNRPEWMILDVVPVIPPEIRPMVQLDGGRFATSDLNDLYRRVINRNNRLKKLLELGAPEIIVRNEKRMLQESVDALIDNGRRGRPVTGANNRAFKSLSDMLKGKQGRFRQNLLGKRVDYSGRSVIVVGPELKIYQCGLPKEMALELFKPFVMKRLVETEKSGNVKSARKAVERSAPEVWDALEIVIKDHPVKLNRAPTLHRLGIQAFEPVLVEGRAIKLHPLVCTAFNADFDGDQMAVHVPLSTEAQAEARTLMLAANNLLKPSDGRPVTVPTQDMVLGSYYLTHIYPSAKGTGKYFTSVNEAQMAYDEGDLDLHALCKIRVTKKTRDGEIKTKLIETSLGRIIFNEPIPQNLGFVNRKEPDKELDLEIDFLVNKGKLGDIIDRVIRKYGTARASEVLDKIKAQGYRFSTRSGLTVAVADAQIPPQKKDILAAAEEKIETINKYYKRGLISNDERSSRSITAWEQCTEEVATALSSNLDEFNPINMMVDSGARGSKNQLRQLAGMRGLIANTAGKTIEIPIRANYREGLNILEYFIASRGARKGLADTALRTADSGYLTRRLVDVSQDVIIHELDCHCDEGAEVYDVVADNRVIVPLKERLTGRYLLEDLVDEETGAIIQSNEVIMKDDDAARVASYVKEHAAPGTRPSIHIRSLLTCTSERGVCAKCYGANLATGDPVNIGEAVGIIAAQSIGEPGTQLTMRTFHTGGARDASDITQGLPRVEELFEARKPKLLALISEIDGVVSFREIKKAKNVIVTAETIDGSVDERAYPIPYDQIIKVVDGQRVRKGENITEGARNPHDILAVLGVHDVHSYLIQEVQRTYRNQGVDISDKHIEVIIRQMMRKVKITEPGDSHVLPGTLLEKLEYRRLCDQIREEFGEDARVPECAPVLMGITKASLATDSFLSAASFQETTRVLTDAAIKGKSDPLIGLKENVIIGKLLPSGTGMPRYGNVTLLDTDSDFAQQYLESLH
ncbi:MAG: DNA-directed RNA polymerase subunit beta' [Oscillospiraceae bacterium]|jgi:DNA-directed RNA polymerase subunit beta'|nr:DNA-directed RNA polymerase subunit beta' [Oscillospiraceae bacterium]